MTTPRRGRRSISDNVWLLQSALAKILNDEDRTLLIHSLNQYQRDRNVVELVASLKRILDSPKKREVYPLLREIIPASDKRYFEKSWRTNQPQHSHPSGSWNISSSTRSRSRTQNRPQEHLRRSQLYSSLPENLDKCDSGVDLPVLKKSSSSRSFHKHPIRRLYLKRAPGTGYGFCMRGGSEHGVGLYVSSVDDNSIAEYEGLLPGDHILSVNQIQFDGLSHDQAVKIIKNNKKLNMVVRFVGQMPDTFVAESTYKWINPAGQRVPPPPNVDSNGREMSIDGIHRSDLRLLGDDDERKVNVFIEDGDKLGLKIRGGAEYGLGIYIAGVDPNSAAQKAGLKCGDQIMDVNGISFLNITHEDAVRVLKSAKNMMVTMKDVGRLPFAKSMRDRTRWSKGKLPYKPVQSDAESTLTTTVQIHEPPDYRRHTTAGRSRFETERSETSKFHHGIAGSQLLYNGAGPSPKSLVEDQARQVLNENELGTMGYYMDEYCKGFITVDEFVLALFSLFNSPAKMSLLSDVRGLIHPRNIDRFDDLVLKKEIEAIKKRNIKSTESRDDTHSIRSYSSSFSNFSELGSSSSRSSTKESLDSRPTTPPRVPEVLPENMKVLRVQNDFTKLTSKQTYDDTVNEGLQSFLPNDDTLNDSQDSMPSPPKDFSTVFPLSSSSPRKPKNSAVTNGEITKYLATGDNTRENDVLHKKRDSKKPHKHSEKKENSLKKKRDHTISDKEHSKAKNDSQSSSDLSFELIPEAKKEKHGFFLHLNKGSYSPYKRDQSFLGKESSNLYHVSVVKKKDEKNTGDSLERSLGEVEKSGNHDGTSSNLSSKTKPADVVSGEKENQMNNSENAEEKNNDTTLVFDNEPNTSPSKLMNGYRTSSKKQTDDNSLATEKLDASKRVSKEVGKKSSTSNVPFKPKPYHAKTEGQNMEESIANINLEGSLITSSPSNSAFAPPKPKPYISQAADIAAKDVFKKDDQQRKQSSPQGDLEKNQAAQEIVLKQHGIIPQEDDYVDIDSIRRSKQLSRQKNKNLEKDISGQEVEHEYVDPKVIDLAAKPPPKPEPYASKLRKSVPEKHGFNAQHNGHQECSEAQMVSGSLVTCTPPKPKPYSPKGESNAAIKDNSNTNFVGDHENSETHVESKINGTSPKSDPFSSLEKGVAKNSDTCESKILSNGSNFDSPKPKVHDLTSSYGQVNGMFLAMEETTTTRSGLEKSTSWGEESLPLCSSIELKSAKEHGKLGSVKKPLQQETFIDNSNYAKIDNSRVLTNHDDNEMMTSNSEIITQPDKEGMTQMEDTTGSHASPKQEDMTRRSVTGTHISSKQENDARTESMTDIQAHSKVYNVTTLESVTKSHTLEQNDTPLKYDVNQNIEELPQKQSVLNMIKAFNSMSDSSNTTGHLSRKGSATNRKSWDGVGNPSKTGQEQKQELSLVEKKKSLKSSSDSNLMNLPKDQKKNIQVKQRASQELLELRQQSRESSTNNSRKSSIDVNLPSETLSLTVSRPPVQHTQLQRDEGYDVEIEKTSKGLGLTLEGGSDTSSKNAPVKIKLVKEGPFDAFTCGKLRPGQTLLQIDDKPVQGMTNAMAIMTLRQAYSNAETKTLLLAVKDP